MEHLELKDTRLRIDGDDADLSGSAFVDCNLSACQIQESNLAGSALREVSLRGVTISHSGLVNVRIEHCDLNGMTIDGVSVLEMIAAWKEKTAKEKAAQRA